MRKRLLASFVLMFCALAVAEDSPPPSANFVASKKSGVFHVPSRAAAKKIKAENTVAFATRDEAIKAGKRTCLIPPYA